MLEASALSDVQMDAPAQYPDPRPVSLDLARDRANGATAPGSRYRELFEADAVALELVPVSTLVNSGRTTDQGARTTVGKSMYDKLTAQPRIGSARETESLDFKARVHRFADGSVDQVSIALPRRRIRQPSRWRDCTRSIRRSGFGTRWLRAAHSSRRGVDGSRNARKNWRRATLLDRRQVGKCALSPKSHGPAPAATRRWCD